MICSLEDIRTKEVIDILTGERLGFIDDVRMNLETSEIAALIIYGRDKLFGLLGKDEDIIIPCREIEVIGHDVILIRRSERTLSSGATNNRKIFAEKLFR
ncbi:MAG: YlmC/YmxH family sporulation protein [Ruminococcus sp.]|nr:YlmC/YmxH family sporulation protein [Ruminococcus sp.]